MEEVKLAIKPHYNKGRINKDEYKDIMRRAVPKVTSRFSSVRARVNAAMTLAIQYPLKTMETEALEDGVASHSQVTLSSMSAVSLAMALR